MAAGGQPARSAAGGPCPHTEAAVTPPHPEAAAGDAERAAGRDSAEGRRGLGDFVSALPPEISSRIFSGLDVDSLCHASVTCKGWHRVIESNERLWRHHCLAVRAVCQREIDCDRGNGYSWKITLLRNYWKSKVKQEWLSGKYSNIPSQFSLPEKSMYPMDVDTWGEILEAELER
ncbi:F-box only protein 48 [Cinclus cinclus]